MASGCNSNKDIMDMLQSANVNTDAAINGGNQKGIALDLNKHYMTILTCNYLKIFFNLKIYKKSLQNLNKL